MPEHPNRAKRRAAACLGAAAVALLAGCSSTTSTSAPPTPSVTGIPSGPTVTVAVEGPMTGPQAATGIDMLHGAQLAASSINNGGGVLSRKIEVVAANDAADPATGAAVARQMVAKRVAAVIGPFNSSVGVEALPIYKAAGIAILRMTSATATEGYGVTTQPMVTQIAPVEAREMTSVLHATSVAILYDPSTYTAGISAQLASLLKADGVKVPVDQALAPNAPAATVTSALTAVRDASPSVTYLAMYAPEAGQLSAVLTSALAPNPTAKGGDHEGSYGQCFVDLAAQGPAFVASATAHGAPVPTGCLASGVPPPADEPGGASYVSYYKLNYKTPPGTWGPFTYDAMQLLANEADDSGQWFGPDLRNALEHATAFTGVTGRIAITAGSGNRVDPPVVILGLSPQGQYVIDAAWASATGYGAPAATPSTTAPG